MPINAGRIQSNRYTLHAPRKQIQTKGTKKDAKKIKWGGDRRKNKALDAKSPFFWARASSFVIIVFYYRLPLTRSSSEMVIRPVFPFSLVDPFIPASPRIFWRSPLELFSFPLYHYWSWLFSASASYWSCFGCSSDFTLLSFLPLLVSVETCLLLAPEAVVMLWALLKLFFLSLCIAWVIIGSIEPGVLLWMSEIDFSREISLF